MTSLFDDFERTNTRWASHQESRFAFLNRIATPGWSAVRDELGRWFDLYRGDAGSQKANDLRNRFRDANPRQHHGAWWELYVYRLLRAVYSERLIRVEPDLPQVSTRPDFAVADEAGQRNALFVEAVTAFTGIVEEEERNAALVAYVVDTINEIKSADFWVHLDFAVVGIEWPKKNEIKRPIEAWLATLDREVELGKVTEGRRFEQLRFR